MNPYLYSFTFPFGTKFRRPDSCQLAMMTMDMDARSEAPRRLVEALEALNVRVFGPVIGC